MLSASFAATPRAMRSSAPPVELLIGITHRLRARLAEHNLKINRLEALVDIAVDDAGRAGDAFPGPELDVDAPAAFVLDERGEITLQHEEHFLDLVRMRRISLPGLDVHDGKR